jgi:hypothetical protein
MRENILKNWARFATTHPWWVIAVLLIVTVIAAFSASKLKTSMRWSDLLPMSDPMSQEFDRILKEYKSASNSIIVIQGKENEIKQFAERIVPQIKNIDEFVERVDYKIDKEFFANHGFMLSREKDLERSSDMFKDLNLIPFLTHINDNFEAEYIEDEGALSTKEKEDNAVRYLDGIQFWIETMNKFINPKEEVGKALADSTVDLLLFGDPYFISHDKNTLLINVEPTFNAMEINKDIASTDSIQKILDLTLKDFTNVRVGLTGTIPLARDEMVYGMQDMKIGSLIAIVLVLILFMLSFRMWSAPLLAILNLILAIIITAGVSAIFLERLNQMSIMFAVILIGLGIDYSIHIISVYNERRVIEKDNITAMEQTLIRSGSGIITGALTTAIAFFALSISTSRGIKETGIILGIGIISAMITSLAGLPAFLVVVEKFSKKIKHKPFTPRNIDFKILGNFGKVVKQIPIFFLLIGIILTGFLVYQAWHVKFDYNYLNMEPKGIPSVVLQDTMIKAFDLSPDFAMVTTSSIEESWEIAEKAKEMPTISTVENIADYCPPMNLQEKRRPHIEEIRRQLKLNIKDKNITGDNLPELIEQLERLDMNICELSQLAFIGGQDKVDKKCRSIVGEPEADNSRSVILNLVENINRNSKIAINGLNRFQRYYRDELRNKVYKMANPEFIMLDKLPEHIKNRYLNDNGDKFLVTIFAKQQLWDFEFLRRFSSQLELISPDITGTPPMFLRLIKYIGRDGKRATILTVIIVLLLLWIDFRSLKHALLGIIPLIIGAIWMVGLLKTFGLMLTFVNVMGIPMIVGIGIDDGVHLLHRYRIEGFSKTPYVLRSTGKAILLTSLTTMVGFGSLTVAKYRGFASLGALLVLGVGACFLTTVLFLPAIINLTLRNDKSPKVN